MKSFFTCFIILQLIVPQQSLLLENGKIEEGYINMKPLGRNVSLSYDEFFKAYIVKYSDIDGKKEEMKFVWDPDGAKESESFSTGSYSFENNFFFVKLNNAQEFILEIDDETGEIVSKPSGKKKGDIESIEFVEVDQKYSYRIYDFKNINLKNN